MARFKRILIELDGREPIEIQTNAFDYAKIHSRDDGDGWATFEVAHNACRRTGVDVPAKLADFMNALTGMPVEVDEADEAIDDPTRRAAPATGPPPSP